MTKQFAIYFLSNYTNNVLYVGVTNNLIKRIYEHKNKVDLYSFTAKYNVNKLVYYELYDNPESAISREKQIKSWSRKRKEKLIESMNPNYNDLFLSIL